MACGLIAVCACVVATARQVGGGGQACSFIDHHSSQLTPEQRDCAYHWYSYTDTVTDFIGPTEAEVLKASRIINAICSPEIPCDFINPTGSWSYTKRYLKQYSVSGSASAALKFELANALVGKIGIEPEFVISGQWTREEEVVISDTINYTVQDCVKQEFRLYDFERHVAGSKQQKEVYVFLLGHFEGCSSGVVETECVKGMASGDSENNAFSRLATTIEPCCDWPDCCSRPCPP